MKISFLLHHRYRSIYCWLISAVYSLLIYMLYLDVKTYKGTSQSRSIGENNKHRIGRGSAVLAEFNYSVLPKRAKVNTKYWKSRKEFQRQLHFLQCNTSSLYQNISDYALTINNLWPPIDPINSFNEHGDRVLEQLIWITEAAKNPCVDKLKTKKIMLINTFQWWHFTSNEDFRKDCPGFGNKCEFLDLDPKTKLGQPVTLIQADSIVTVSAGKLSGSIKMDLEVLRFFYILESSFHAEAVLRRRNDILASYWRGSNLVTPYAKWVYYNNSVQAQKQERNFATGKTKLVAITMSFCDSENNRLQYVKELQQHISVDIYGRCGTLNCSRPSCFDKLSKEYKFYLAFENSNCRDYITEKFFRNALRNNIIAVVMGAHPADYRSAGPRHSFIHVEDFESPQALAQYLLYLDKNDTEYNKYFEWKGTGEFIDLKFLCRVCAMTHYADYVPPPERTNVFRWANTDKHKLCLLPGQLYWRSSGTSSLDINVYLFVCIIITHVLIM